MNAVGERVPTARGAPRALSDYPRRIFLAVTGLSPQVITESLYALAMEASCDPEAFVPTEVHVITTGHGMRLVEEALLSRHGGQFATLLDEYPVLGRPVFSSRNIHVIRDPSGKALPDIRTPCENARAADTITALMAAFTRDQHSALHVSIAGGRKTMGFYLGYAFSLFARPQDVLSHVLVSPDFENHPDFFYPPVRPRRLVTRHGHELNTADADVTLARIPVVHLRHGLPRDLLQGRENFNDTVSAIEKSLAPPRLHINLRHRQAVCGDIPVRLPPALITWFAWWAQLRLTNQEPQSWRTASAQTYLQLYRRVVRPSSSAYLNAAIRLAEGMEKEFFEQNNSKLARALKDQLGPAATPYLLTTTGRRPFSVRSLTLPPDAITLELE